METWEGVERAPEGEGLNPQTPTNQALFEIFEVLKKNLGDRGVPGGYSVSAPPSETPFIDRTCTDHPLYYCYYYFKNNSACFQHGIEIRNSIRHQCMNKNRCRSSYRVSEPLSVYGLF